MKYFNKFDTQQINEFLQQQERWLYNYLNMSEEDKYIDLAHNQPYYFFDYFEENDLEIEEMLSEEEFTEIKNMIDNGSQEYEVVEKLSEKKDLLEKFGRYVEDTLRSEHMDSDLSTPFFFGSPEIIKKQWLVHLTDHASDIWKDGFTHGSEEMDKLGLTTYNNHSSKKYGGYNFAYTPYDFDRYGDMGDHKHNFRYGDEAILFRSSGVRAMHYGDEEYQTMFWGEYASDIIWMEYGEIEHGDNEGEDCWFIESRITGERLIEKEEVSDLVDWVEKHYDQYRKHLFTRSNSNKRR
jgi:hypothetical protein